MNPRRRPTEGTDFEDFPPGSDRRGPRGRNHRGNMHHQMMGDPRFGMGGMNPRRARRGDVRSAVLSLLSDEPLNGYQLIKRIARSTGGMWRPSSGSIYPILSRLSAEGLIEAIDDEPRTAYQLTDAGRTYVTEHASELAEAWNIDPGMSDDIIAMRESFMRVTGAVQQLAIGATDEQAQNATKILDETRRSLYGILAD